MVVYNYKKQGVRHYGGGALWNKKLVLKVNYEIPLFFVFINDVVDDIFDITCLKVGGLNSHV